MVLWVGEPRYRNLPWLIKKHDAFERWVPKKDRNGRQVTETVTVKGKKVRKKVWERISGEIKVFHAQRSVALPYRVVIYDLRKNVVALDFSGEVLSDSRSSYYEYTGDPRGEKPPPVRYKGRANAPALLSEKVLTNRALAELPGQVVTTTLKRVE